jgi:hypothetical protein
MRFYFHLHNDIQTTDEEGRELPDIDAALAEAREDARTMAAESVRLGHLDLSHFIEVVDEGGHCHFRVEFRDVVALRDSAEGQHAKA